jgi:hypothetical protein
MKLSMLAKSSVFASVLLVAASLFAVNKGALEVTDAVVVNGTTLPAGDYSLTWDGSGPTVQLNILKGHKVVATTPARLVDKPNPQGRDSALLRINPDGTRSLAEVRFGGKKYSLEIGPEGEKSDMMGSK